MRDLLRLLLHLGVGMFLLSGTPIIAGFLVFKEEFSNLDQTVAYALLGIAVVLCLVGGLIAFVTAPNGGKEEEARSG